TRTRNRAIRRAGTRARRPGASCSAWRRCWASAPISARCWTGTSSRWNCVRPAPVSFALAELLGDAGVPALAVTGVNADSRAIRPGEAFFAVPGTRVHGDAFASQARAGGAAVMVTDRVPTEDAGLPVVLVPDVRAAYAPAAARAVPPPPGVAVAVTGTNGKSSVVSFTRQIWAACGIAAASLGTVGVETSAGIEPGELTTPDALSLHRTLNGLRARGIGHVALEASSQGLDQRRV